MGKHVNIEKRKAPRKRRPCPAKVARWEGVDVRCAQGEGQLNKICVIPPQQRERKVGYSEETKKKGACEYKQVF